METSNVINLVLVLVTGIGVLMTAWQALDARAARDEARAARDEASAHEQSAARSAFRSAEALEKNAEIAGSALAETNRANRLEEEDRNRAGRAEFSVAVDSFLTGWQPRWYLGDRLDINTDTVTSLKRTAAGISSDAEDLANWLLNELKRSVNQVVEDHKDWDSNAGDAMLQMAVRAIRSEAHRRVIDWVGTGKLDSSPLGPSATAPR